MLTATFVWPSSTLSVSISTPNDSRCSRARCRFGPYSSQRIQLVPGTASQSDKASSCTWYIHAGVEPSTARGRWSIWTGIHGLIIASLLWYLAIPAMPWRPCCGLCACSTSLIPLHPLELKGLHKGNAVICAVPSYIHACYNISRRPDTDSSYHEFAVVAAPLCPYRVARDRAIAASFCIDRLYSAQKFIDDCPRWVVVGIWIERSAIILDAYQDLLIARDVLKLRASVASNYVSGSLVRKCDRHDKTARGKIDSDRQSAA